jgi:peroxiredoxin
MKALSSIRSTALLTVAMLLAACSREAPDDGAGAPDRVEYGSYRAALVVPGGDLPFGLELAREGDRDVAYLVNGPERVRVDEVTITGDRATLLMPGNGNKLTVQASADGLEGEAVLLRPKGVLKTWRLLATRDAKYRFFPTPSARNSDFAGRWAMTFTDEKGKQDTAIGVFTQTGHEVVGTLLRASGDDRYIAGEANGDALFLSRFDGGSAQLYRARLNDRGELEGEFWTGGGAHLSFVGRRDDKAALEDPATLSKLKPGAARLAFTFPDADGKPVSLSDERFRGKVVIVTIGGTWCPNCHDEVIFLGPFLAERRARGLEAIGLMFEYVGDFSQAAALVRRFDQRYKGGFPLLVAGTSDKDEVVAKLPVLQNLYAYPTTLVIDRKGDIRHVHAGFSGPATGAAYESFKSEFTALIDGLLAEG